MAELAGTVAYAAGQAAAGYLGSKRARGEDMEREVEGAESGPAGDLNFRQVGCVIRGAPYTRPSRVISQLLYSQLKTVTYRFQRLTQFDKTYTPDASKTHRSLPLGVEYVNTVDRMMPLYAFNLTARTPRTAQTGSSRPVCFRASWKTNGNISWVPQFNECWAQNAEVSTSSSVNWVWPRYSSTGNPADSIAGHMPYVADSKIKIFATCPHNKVQTMKVQIVRFTDHVDIADVAGLGTSDGIDPLSVWVNTNTSANEFWQRFLTPRVGHPVMRIPSIKGDHPRVEVLKSLSVTMQPHSSLEAAAQQNCVDITYRHDRVVNYLRSNQNVLPNFDKPWAPYVNVWGTYPNFGTTVLSGSSSEAWLGTPGDTPDDQADRVWCIVSAADFLPFSTAGEGNDGNVGSFDILIDTTHKLLDGRLTGQ